MQIESGHSNISKNQNISFEDFDIENIPFKPITDGLGFSNKSNDFKRTKKVNKAKVHEKIYSEMISKESAVISDTPAELDAFYKRKSPAVNKKIDLTKRIEREAELSVRFNAWTIDMIVVTALFSIVSFLMFTSTAFNMNSFIGFLKQDLNFIFPVIIFCLIYTIYSAVLGFRQTVGQKIMKIKPLMSTIKNDPVTFLIKRTMLELISIPLVGIPYFLKMDLKSLGNKVIRE